MASVKALQYIISIGVSFFINQPLVTAISKKYFGLNITPTVHTIISVATFVSVGFCLYLFLQDLFSILCHKSNNKTAASHT